MLKTYYRLTKPGIIYGNALTVIAGFLLASKNHIVGGQFAGVLFGTSLVIAGACVFNNYIDRDIDKKMARTKRRALVVGKISSVAALSYGTALAVIGFAILMLGTNTLTVTIGAIAFVDYVILYGLAKRTTIHSTLVGTVAGAAPVVAGYTAVVNRLDTGVFLLFLFMVFWQMAHFYAIGIYRLADYSAAGLPILPVRRGVAATQPHIIFFMLCVFVTVFGLFLTGYISLLSAFILGTGITGWLRLSAAESYATNPTHWARQIFLFSLVIILLFSSVLSLNFWLS